MVLPARLSPTNSESDREESNSTSPPLSGSISQWMEANSENIEEPIPLTVINLEDAIINEVPPIDPSLYNITTPVVTEVVNQLLRGELLIDRRTH